LPVALPLLLIALLTALTGILPLLLIVAVVVAIMLATLLTTLSTLLILLIVLAHDFTPCGMISACCKRHRRLRVPTRQMTQRNHTDRSSLHAACCISKEERMAETRETYDLIGSDKVEGTNVYGPDGNKIGSIERVMIGKRSGKVDYAVLSFGGFMGFGDEHYPLPWTSLKYNETLGGYQVNVTEQQLKGAPKYANENDWDWADPVRGRKVHDYYGAAWMY
jgi:hypothetical protein